MLLLSGFHKIPDSNMYWETFLCTFVQAAWFLEGSTPPIKIVEQHLCSTISKFLSFFFFVFTNRRLSVTFDIQIDFKMKHPKLTLESQFRSIFRTLTNIQEEGFRKNSCSYNNFYLFLLKAPS